MYQLQRLLEVR